MNLSKQQQKEQNLTDAGLTIFIKLNAGRYEWYPKDADANRISPRFTSRDQATNYAHYRLQKQKEADKAIEAMIAYSKTD